ncbi:type II secretion system protein GspD [Thiosulfativibrio zosterae]|uniref:Type II/III secretion system secretin-like domain-containing protein n=1 Tax=Thiosulfativibrio zosterae TaxID=2675053 RepID=A0A6F8PQY6_9GAMM|nr:hypothetical protein [Thiosulfativibrio zosterae]BBP44525.1 hypothetical protein THMIRHAT_22710 [Thiosulfativibrio zosterae]
MYLIKVTFLFFLFVLLAGCSAQRDSLPKMLMYEQPVIAKSIQSSNMVDTAEGIDINSSGEVVVKASGRPILTLIDELAYKRRFNYTIEGQIPDTLRPEIVDASCRKNKSYEECGKWIFKNEEDFFSTLMIWLSTPQLSKSQVPFEVLQTADGFKFRPKDSSLRTQAFKKVFLFNLTSIEAQAQLNTLFPSSDDKPLKIVSIPSQNALVINEPLELLERIGNIFLSVDADAPQVLIESRVFEYDEALNRKIGTALQYAEQSKDMTYGLSTIFGQNLTTEIGNLLINQTDTERKQTILASLAFEAADSGVKILAEPRLMVKPGKQSSIYLNSVKYVSLTGIQTVQLEKIETGIEFKVTPTILSEKSILLEIEIKQSEFLPNSEPGVSQNTNENRINTSIVVNDGELISLGGIYLDKADTGSYGLPYLKDAPGLGWLFGSSSSTKSRGAIEFMIRPTIKNIKKRIEDNQEKMLDFTKEREKEEAE